jgi:hypothetical protein
MKPKFDIPEWLHTSISVGLLGLPSSNAVVFVRNTAEAISLEPLS